jgi:ubiquinone/menaquinone biosynthesis C-methylase UbiE
MSDPLAAAKLKAETAYNAAADYFDAEPLAFWARYGRRTVERLRLRRGARVLDVCCGTGASALPEAQAAGLSCVEFRSGDMTGLSFPDRHFDAVVQTWPRPTLLGKSQWPISNAKCAHITRNLCSVSRALHAL